MAFTMDNDVGNAVAAVSALLDCSNSIGEAGPTPEQVIQYKALKSAAATAISIAGEKYDELDADNKLQLDLFGTVGYLSCEALETGPLFNAKQAARGVRDGILEARATFESTYLTDNQALLDFAIDRANVISNYPAPDDSPAPPWTQVVGCKFGEFWKMPEPHGSKALAWLALLAGAAYLYSRKG